MSFFFFYLYFSLKKEVGGGLFSFDVDDEKNTKEASK